MAEVQIQKMRIRHEAILSWLLLHPDAKHSECAEHFGVTEPWLSVVIHSDVFQARLREMRMLMDGEMTKVVNGKIHAVVDKSLERLGAMMEVSSDPAFVLQTTDKLLGRLGYGVKGAVGVQVNVQQNTLMASPEVLEAARRRMALSGQQIAVELQRTIPLELAGREAEHVQSLTNEDDIPPLEGENA